MIEISQLGIYWKDVLFFNHQRRVEGENLKDGYRDIVGSIVSTSGLSLMFPPTIQCVFSQKSRGNEMKNILGTVNLSPK